MDFWTTIEKTLKFSQTAALLEIVHSMLGLVRSPVMTTTLQGILYRFKSWLVFSRIMLLWGYANPCPDAQQSWSIKLMVLSWSLVEVPRYLFYLFKLLNISMPTWLLFLRYNLFIVLYPTGISGRFPKNGWWCRRVVDHLQQFELYQEDRYVFSSLAQCLEHCCELLRHFYLHALDLHSL